jgi:hypothetical protein
LLTGQAMQVLTHGARPGIGTGNGVEKPTKSFLERPQIQAYPRTRN